MLWSFYRLGGTGRVRKNAFSSRVEKLPVNALRRSETTVRIPMNARGEIRKHMGKIDAWLAVGDNTKTATEVTCLRGEGFSTSASK